MGTRTRVSRSDHSDSCLYYQVCNNVLSWRDQHSYLQHEQRILTQSECETFIIGSEQLSHNQGQRTHGCIRVRNRSCHSSIYHVIKVDTGLWSPQKVKTLHVWATNLIVTSDLWTNPIGLSLETLSSSGLEVCDLNFMLNILTTG